MASTPNDSLFPLLVYPVWVLGSPGGGPMTLNCLGIFLSVCSGSCTASELWNIYGYVNKAHIMCVALAAGRRWRVCSQPVSNRAETQRVPKAKRRLVLWYNSLHSYLPQELGRVGEMDVYCRNSYPQKVVRCCTSLPLVVYFWNGWLMRPFRFLFCHFCEGYLKEVSLLLFFFPLYFNRKYFCRILGLYPNKVFPG